MYGVHTGTTTTTTLTNGGRGYVSRAAARAAADRRGLVPTETFRIGERLPGPDDAAGWDACRRAAGLSGDR